SPGSVGEMAESRLEGLILGDEAMPAWLPVALRRALRRPAGDPIGAALAVVRLLRSGRLDEPGREEARRWLVTSLDEAMCELISTAVEGLAERLLDDFHAWIQADPEADDMLAAASWTRDGTVVVADAELPTLPGGALQVADGPAPGWCSGAFRPWDVVRGRDDAESLVMALTTAVIGGGGETPAFWERLARERLAGADRVGETLEVLLSHRLAAEPGPGPGAWLVEVGPAGPSAWWLDAVVRAAAIRGGLVASLRPLDEEPPDVVFQDAIRRLWPPALARLDEEHRRSLEAPLVIPDYRSQLAAASARRPTRSHRTEWEAVDGGWWAFLWWPAEHLASEDELVDLEIRSVPPQTRAASLAGVVVPVEDLRAGEATARARFRLGDLRHGAPAGGCVLALLVGDPPRLELGLPKKRKP
ncbi:MAG: hypothetical protein QME96_09035, partial [Myxococcota bacterium]|nr:hypothetical protein [Myxococcota bacterium]